MVTISGGFLNGKFRRDKPRPESAPRSNELGNFLPVDEEKGYLIIGELDLIAKAHDASVAQAALNYLLQKPAVSSVIVGATKPEQLQDNLKAVEWDMTPGEVKRLDDLSATPKPILTGCLNTRSEIGCRPSASEFKANCQRGGIGIESLCF